MLNAIPEITDPMGKHWSQPYNIRSVPMDDDCVLLTKQQLQELPEYSSTLPSGVYNGKCWRRRERSGWLLAWYDNHPTDPKLCSIKSRRILIGRFKENTNG